MSGQITTRQTGGQMITAEQSAAIRTALKTSLYPGATDDGVTMVLAYCQAAGLDPMTKPVHIVPMWIPEKKVDGKVITPAGMRDVVMPGIELYRTKAHRTGEYAGQDEAEYGPTITTKLGGVDVSYPEWCRVNVYRMLDGQRVGYSARVYWLESYATKSKDTEAPNAMWKKRPFGQLEKCAEAAALRKAFPEAVGAQPTAEEMEGKTLEASVVSDQARPAFSERQALSAADAQSSVHAEDSSEGGGDADESGSQANQGDDAPLVNEGHVRMLRSTLSRRSVGETKFASHFKIGSVELLPVARMNDAMDWIKAQKADSDA